MCKTTPKKFSTWEDLSAMADSAPPTMDMDLDPLALGHTPPDPGHTSVMNPTSSAKTPKSKKGSSQQLPLPQKSTRSASKVVGAQKELPHALLQELMAIAAKEGMEQALKQAYSAGILSLSPSALQPTGLSRSTWASVAAAPVSPPKPASKPPSKPTTMQEPKPSALISMKSVAFRPSATIQALPPKQVLA